MFDDSDFSVEVTSIGDGHVVKPRGEIDLATIDRLRAACDQATGRLVIDLREVSFMDTSGLALLIERQRRAQAAGEPFVLVRGPANVQKLFEVAGLAHRLQFVDDPAEVLGDGRPAS